MSNKQGIVIIPAKGRSVGLPGKNMKDLLGFPLIQYTLWAAKDTVDPGPLVIVSTDSQEIATYASSQDVTAILRPPELCKDNTTCEEVISHVLKDLKQNHDREPEYFGFMQITDIMRPIGILNTFIDLITNTTLDCVFSGYKTHKRMWTEDGALRPLMLYPRTPRQDNSGPKVMREDTGICLVTRTKAYINSNLRHKTEDRIPVYGSTTCYLNDDPNSSVDIHTIEDLKLAEFLLQADMNNADENYRYYHAKSAEQRSILTL